MRRIQRDEHAIVIELEDQELHLVKRLLSGYPLVDNQKRELSKETPPANLIDDTELLRSSLNERAEHNRQRLARWLGQDQTLTAKDDGWHLTLALRDIDWFLQILNDLRVGSWHQLGCPGPEEQQQMDYSAENVQALWTMEIAGALQMMVLQSD